MSVRTLIVDDEPLARERLRNLLARDPDIELVGECGDGRCAVREIQEKRPDLLLLDVQMPEMNGFEVLQKFREEDLPALIFVTAYDQYALQAFDAHALDYLLKPFDEERFRKALHRAKLQIVRRKLGPADRDLEPLHEDEGRAELKAADKDRMIIRSGGRVIFLKADEIDWIEAAGNYLRIHAGKESHLMRETMASLEARLDGNKFMRIHRSTIVNVEKIRELQPWFGGEYVVVLRNGHQLTLSRTYRDRLNILLKM